MFSSFAVLFTLISLLGAGASAQNVVCGTGSVKCPAKTDALEIDLSASSEDASVCE